MTKIPHLEDIPEFEELKCDTTDNGRFYSGKGFKYPSVTTILSRGTDQSWKDAWIARVGKEEAERVSRKATRRGEVIHSMAEDFLHGKDWKSGRMPDSISTFLPVSKALGENLSGIGGIEVPLFSHSLRMAGRVDCFGIWKGVWSVIDFKTSKRSKSRDDIHSYFLQKSAYAQMIFERTGIPIRKLVTVMCPDDRNDALIFEEKTVDWLEQMYEIRDKVKKTHGI